MAETQCNHLPRVSSPERGRCIYCGVMVAPLDHGQLNVPLSKRVNADREISKAKKYMQTDAFKRYVRESNLRRAADRKP